MTGAFPPADAALIAAFDVISKSRNPLESIILMFKLLFDHVHELGKYFRRDTFAMELYLYLKNRDRRAKLYTDLLEKMEQNSVCV